MPEAKKTGRRFTRILIITIVAYKALKMGVRSLNHLFIVYTTSKSCGSRSLRT